MKIYEKPYSYDIEDFKKNNKFSCHSWLLKCISNLTQTNELIENNLYSLNDVDLVGKYNCLNYLLEIYQFHQNNKFKHYPSNQDPYKDFNWILFCLLSHNINIEKPDYHKKTFFDNLTLTIESDQYTKWKKDYKFVDNTSMELFNNSNSRKDIIQSILRTNLNSTVYLNLYLNLNLKENEKPILRNKL